MVEGGLEGHHITSAHNIYQSRAETVIPDGPLQQRYQQLSIISADVSHYPLAARIQQTLGDLTLKLLTLGRRESPRCAGS